MRARTGILALAAGVGVAVVPAVGADQTVTATGSNQFSPRTVAIAPGEKVTWRNQQGFHNVKFDDGSFEEPDQPDPTPWTAERRFDREGEFRYYCEQHGGPGGSGMAGLVIVGSGGTTGAATTGTSGGTTGGGTSTGSGTTGGGTTGGGTPPPKPRLTGVSARGGPFCVRRTRRCPRPGVRLRLRLSHAATLDGSFLHRPRRGAPYREYPGTLRLQGRRGLNRFRFTTDRGGKRLRPGDYILRLRAFRGGQDSFMRIVRFRVRSR